MSEPKRTRKKNFTPNETNRLIELVEDNYRIISSKFSDQVTLKRKNDAWLEISRKLNAISPCLRTVEEVKKKWDDIEVRAKKKANEDRTRDGKTGNVPRSPKSDSLTDTERRVIGMLGAAQVFGINNRDEYDTAALPSYKKESKRSRQSATATRACVESDDAFDELMEAPTQTFGNYSDFDEPADSQDEDFRVEKPPPKKTPRVSPTTSNSTSAGKKSVTEMMLDVETRRLDVDKRRLQVEEKTLTTLEQLVDIEKKKLELMTRQQSISNAPKPRPNVSAITEGLSQKLGKKGAH
ncbi:nuclear apoptosis-inducing factor 1-like [Lineus longissimus]|uniref:nuclear apoptosis-inducing factor 1-like n=1 Tax=Lineus longissimus TaxID=88925 RepID=UPI00315CB43B